MKVSGFSSFFIEVARFLLVLLFVYTAIGKLSDHGAFYSSLIGSPITREFAGLLRWAVPALELSIAILLLVPGLKRAGLLASFILLTSFTIYVGCMILFVDHPPCSCGGVINGLSWPQHLWFNLFFTLLSAAAYLGLTLPIFFIAISPGIAGARGLAGDAENLDKESRLDH
ncbi:MAG TPA: MauE/DoxX family redox-associated membrane protein [Chitinophagaceae bacterium]|nr:MauE/DoxX family redox-associated membrane protein [Chitinophagaceae bacterium]